MKIGIIGAGIVGGTIEKCFEGHHELYIHDPSRNTSLDNLISNYD